MSRKSQAKQARRKKRRATQSVSWLSDGAHQRLADELDVFAALKEFDDQLTDRGWMFSDDSDEEHGAIWFWPSSYVDELDSDEVANATAVAVVPGDGIAVAHVILAGGQETYEFELDQLFDHLDVIEGYRFGEPAPNFDN